MPTISVVIPVYKAEADLPRCINSILSQSYSDFELILIDDGSPDNSGTICDQYAEKDHRIHVIHKKNAGVSAARNDGIAASTGKYITFIDSDDYIDADFFQAALDEAMHHDADLYVSGIHMDTYQDGVLSDTLTYQIKQHRVLSVKELLEAARSEYPIICICGPWCKLYKRDLIGKHNILFNTNMCYSEDTDFNLSYLDHAETVVFSDRSFYHYCRSNNESLFSRFHPETYETHTAAYDKMRQLMYRLNCCDEAMVWFERHYFTLLLGCMHEYYRFYEQSSAKDKYNLIKKVGRNKYLHAVNTQTFSKQNRLIYILLRCKAYALVQFLFFLHYRVRKH